MDYNGMRTPTSTLNDTHRQMLEVESGIAEDIIVSRGYRTEKIKANLVRLGFSNRQARVPGLTIPIHGVQGNIVSYQLRSDVPRINSKGKAVKYETPAGSRMALDVHPFNKDRIRDPRIPAWITEGIKKADALTSKGCCTIGLLGVTTFRGTNEYGGKTVLPDWEGIALNDRVSYIVFDSDVMQKREVYQALTRLKAFLESRGAKVLLVYLPSEHGEKVGVDDYLAKGKTIDDLQQLATPDLCPLPQSEEDSICPYRSTPQGMIWLKPTKDGPAIAVHLSNFSVRIIADIAEDDGAETRRCLQLEACLNHKTQAFTMPANEFSAMNWPMKYLGANAFLSPGPMIKDHTRAAIQKLSLDPEQRHIFTHIGWRNIEGTWMFLHGGGAIGPNGTENGIQVSLPGALSQYVLPAPPLDADRLHAVQRSLAVLHVAPGRITFPSLAGVVRVPLSPVDFALHWSGPTGVGKTELATLMQQHFGLEFSSRQLPGSWSSTGNSLEAMAFVAKDVLMTVDDFAPTGSSADIQRYHRDADRLIRAQGNRAGRSRLRSDATLKTARFPRGLIGSTGEDIPKGHSLRARTLVLEVGPQDLNWPKLTHCQQDARAGLYAQAMAAYLQWLARNYEIIQAHVPKDVTYLRGFAQQIGPHRRTPEIVANLAVGFHYYLMFAREIGAISSVEQEQLGAQCWQALGEAAQAQSSHQAASEPTTRFLTLFNTALASGKAHMASLEGSEPAGSENEQEWSGPAPFGWREVEVGTGEYVRREWRPQGDRVGWTDKHFVYVDPDAAFATAQKIGQITGDGLALTPHTLKKRLKERGLLVTEPSRPNHLTIRKMIEGRRRDVLCLRLASLDSGKLYQLDQSGEQQTSQDDGTVLSGNWSTIQSHLYQGVDHEMPKKTNGLEANGTVGTVGTDSRTPESLSSDDESRSQEIGTQDPEKVYQSVYQGQGNVGHTDAQEEIVDLDS